LLVAVPATALTRTAESLPAWAVALAVLVASSLLGGLLAGSVRRAGSAQIASAALLSFAGVPVELAAGAPLAGALLTGAAWAAVFVPSALIVRAAFARAARRPDRASHLETASVALCLGAAAALTGFGHFPETIVTGAAAVVCAALCCVQPSVKQMKPVGLTFAGLSALSALLLAL
jgi:hypothetical protein